MSERTHDTTDAKPKKAKGKHKRGRKKQDGRDRAPGEDQGGAGLPSHGVDLRDSYRHDAAFVDKILKGSGALPWNCLLSELVVNRKTAEAMVSCRIVVATFS
jgi:hypothetical protein